MVQIAQHYDDVARATDELSGLSPDAPLPHTSPMGKHRIAEDIQISAGYGHSGFPMQAYIGWGVASPEMYTRGANWGTWHELGHNYQMGAWSYVYGVETTVNLFSLYVQEKHFRVSRLINDDRFTHAAAMLNDPAVTDKWNTGSPWHMLVFLDQIRLAFPEHNWDLWKQLMRRYREMSNAEINALNTDEKRLDKVLEILCDLTNTNLAPHFDVWTVPVSQSAKSFCVSKPALSIQPWTIDGSQPVYHIGNGTGAFQREWWSSLPGTALTDLTSTPSYPSRPSGTEVLTGTLQGPRNWNDQYGQRLRGYLHPPVTGNYEFWISGDDSAQLWLSSDTDPLNATPVLTLTQQTGNQHFDALSTDIQRSQPIALEAGRPYYFHVLHKEGSGGDHVAVAWSIPASSSGPLEVRKLIAPRYLSPYTGNLALQKNLASGQSAIVLRGSDITFTLTISNQSSSAARNIEILDTLPAGFTLSPLNPPGRWQTGYRYVRIEAISEAGNRGPWTTIAELGLLDGAGQPISKNAWRVHYVDSENPGEEASRAFDDNPATFWHTRYQGSQPPHPHELQIDLGNYYPALSGFTYLPRQSGRNGRIGQYRFYISSNGSQWIQVADGIFPDTADLQTVSIITPPVNEVFGMLVGPVAASASTSLDLIARTEPELALGTYTNTAAIQTALDGIYSPLYDRNPADNFSDATVQVALTVPSPTATPVPPTATPVPPTATPTMQILRLDPAQGVVGVANEVVIYGVGLRSDTSIAIGGVPLSNYAVSNGQGTHASAVVPSGLQPGVYDVSAANPGGGNFTLPSSYTVIDAALQDLAVADNDLWFSPATVRQGTVATLGVTVRRSGSTESLPGVNVAFYLNEISEGALLGRQTTGAFSPGNSVIASAAIDWTPPAAGSYVVLVVVDPDGVITEATKANNTARWNIDVLPPAVNPDTTAPTIGSVTANEGAQSTTQQAVTLAINAADDHAQASGLRWMYIAERVYNSSARAWVIRQESGWVDFAPSYTVTLSRVPGIHYLQVWVADAAGNVSTTSARTTINYLPAESTVRTAQVRIYRLDLVAGEQLSVALTPTAGDPDVYIWDQAGNLAAYSNLFDLEQELVEFTSADSGIYQIEVYGYADSVYDMAFELSTPSSRIDASSTPSSKAPIETPSVSPATVPSMQQALPTAPESSSLFLPLVNK